MASASIKYMDVLWEAANNPDIPDDVTWDSLKLYLLGTKKVDISARKQDDWMRSFDHLRRTIRVEEIRARGERSPSTGSEAERRADDASLAETSTSYGSDTVLPHDKSDRPQIIYLIVGQSEKYPEGQAPLGCRYSADLFEDESYIRRTIFKRCSLVEGPDGKLNLSFLKPGGQTIFVKCGVRPEGIADVVIGTKRRETPIRVTEMDEEEGVEGSRNIGDPNSPEGSAARQPPTETPESAAEDAAREERIVAIVMAKVFEDLGSQDLSEEQVDERGLKFRAFARGFMKGPSKAP